MEMMEVSDDVSDGGEEVIRNNEIPITDDGVDVPDENTTLPTPASETPAADSEPGTGTGSGTGTGPRTGNGPGTGHKPEPGTETRPEPATEPQPANSTTSPASAGGFTLNMLRDKIRQLEGRPGGSPKIKELLRKLKVAVDRPQGEQSTSTVYRVVHRVIHYLFLVDIE